MKFKFDKFIQGKTIDLCVATEEIAYESDWYKWFNDKSINKYLIQGKFPNTRIQQRDYFISELSKKRLLLLIVTKESLLKGVISLSKIDFENNSADLALVVNDKISRKKCLLGALEAVALISQHGFDIMRLDRIYARQSRSLSSWQKRMELLGYRVEGIHKNDFYEKIIKRLNSVNWRSKLNYFSFHLSNPIVSSFRNSILKILVKNNKFLDSYLGNIYRD